MEKQCTKCKKVKVLEDFNKRSSSSTGYSSQCKSCNKENLRQHYNKNKKKYLERNRARRKELSHKFLEFKKSLSCINCGESRWWVLDFHHRDPKEKEGYLSRILIQGSITKFEEELKKCDVLCANCHRDVHYHKNDQYMSQ